MIARRPPFLKTMAQVYGKLTSDQLAEIVAWLPVFDQLRAEFNARIDRDPERFEKEVAHGIRWANLYELPYELHLIAVLNAFGLSDFVAKAGAASNPVQVVLDTLNDDGEAFPSSEITLGEGVTMGHALGLIRSLERSLESLLLHQRYLNELVALAATGDRVSLFKAVRIDPAVITCHTLSGLIGKALLIRDEQFLDKLRMALKGPSNLEQAHLRGVKFAMQALRDAGVEVLGASNLVELFVEKLKIYAETPSSNPERALKAHWHKSKRKRDT